MRLCRLGRSLALLAIPALTAALVSTQAPAQDVAAWRVECTGDGRTLDCRAVQQLFQRDTRQLLIAVLVRKAPDPKAALMMIQLFARATIDGSPAMTASPPSTSV